MDEEFTLCEHKTTGGRALLATGALKFWAAKGWSRVPDPDEAPAPKRSRKPATPGDNTESE